MLRSMLGSLGGNAEILGRNSRCWWLSSHTHHSLGECKSRSYESCCVHQQSSVINYLNKKWKRLNNNSYSWWFEGKKKKKHKSKSGVKKKKKKKKRLKEAIMCQHKSNLSFRQPVSAPKLVKLCWLQEIVKHLNKHQGYSFFFSCLSPPH